MLTHTRQIALFTYALTEYAQKFQDYMDKVLTFKEDPAPPPDGADPEPGGRYSINVNLNTEKTEVTTEDVLKTEVTNEELAVKVTNSDLDVKVTNEELEVKVNNKVDVEVKNSSLHVKVESSELDPVHTKVHSSREEPLHTKVHSSAEEPLHSKVYNQTAAEIPVPLITVAPDTHVGRVRVEGDVTVSKIEDQPLKVDVINTAPVQVAVADPVPVTVQGSTPIPVNISSTSTELPIYSATALNTNSNVINAVLPVAITGSQPVPVAVQGTVPVTAALPVPVTVENTVSTTVNGTVPVSVAGNVAVHTEANRPVETHTTVVNPVTIQGSVNVGNVVEVQGPSDPTNNSRPVATKVLVPSTYTQSGTIPGPEAQHEVEYCELSLTRPLPSLLIAAGGDTGVIGSHLVNLPRDVLPGDNTNTVYYSTVNGNVLETGLGPIDGKRLQVTSSSH